MKKIIFAAILFAGISVQAQRSVFKSLRDTSRHKKQRESGFYAGGGVSVSSINFFRNVLENPYRFCYHSRLYADIGNNFRACFQYTYMPRFDFKPTWLNVTNQVFDLDFHLFAEIKNQHALFYTLLGFNYQRWKGQYTGISDFNQLKLLHEYTPGLYYINRYPGFSVGTGIEKGFNEFQFFGEFRFRFTSTESGFGITDAAYNLGLKFFIPYPKKIFRNPKDRYGWF
jgi:hypothetical protein